MVGTLLHLLTLSKRECLHAAIPPKKAYGGSSTKCSLSILQKLWRTVRRQTQPRYACGAPISFMNKKLQPQSHADECKLRPKLLELSPNSS